MHKVAKSGPMKPPSVEFDGLGLGPLVSFQDRVVNLLLVTKCGSGSLLNLRI